MRKEEDQKPREKIIVRASIITIITNIILSVVKIVLGKLSGSVAIMSDAINNIGDCSSSIITIVGTKLSKKKPNKKHPFGYGRIEYLTSLIIGVIVLVSGIEATLSSVKQIIHKEDVNYSNMVIVIMVISIGVKIVLGLYLRNKGNETNSDSLSASGKETTGDAIVTAVAVVSALIYRLAKVNLDGWAGAFVSLVIVKAGIETLIDTISKILGEKTEDNLSEKIYNLIMEENEVIGVHDLILNNYGPEIWIGSVHIEMDHKKTLGEVYPLVHHLMTKIYEELGIVLTFGLYGVDRESPLSSAIWNKLLEFTEQEEHCLGFHGIVIKEREKMVYFDITLDFKCDRKALLDKAREKVEEVCPDYQVIPTIDMTYSGNEYIYIRSF